MGEYLIYIPRYSVLTVVSSTADSIASVGGGETSFGFGAVLLGFFLVRPRPVPPFLEVDFGPCRSVSTCSWCNTSRSPLTRALATFVFVADASFFASFLSFSALISARVRRGRGRSGAPGLRLPNPRERSTLDEGDVSVAGAGGLVMRIEVEWGNCKRELSWLGVKEEHGYA